MATSSDRDLAHMIPSEVKGPRPGKALVGPEFPGCVTAGCPAIYNVKANGKRAWVVVEFDIDAPEFYDSFKRHDFRVGRTTKIRGRQGWFFKTRPPAVREFCRLVNGRLDEIANHREKVKALREARRSNDPAVSIGAALDLADLGAY